MQMNRLGDTGLFVSELCLGTMTFGGEDGMWGQIGRLRQADADALVRAAVESGINFIDTADVYAEGRSEEITGQAIRNLGLKRDEVVVATKAYGPTGDGANSRGSSRYHLIEACKASLKRLHLDHIDLYQLHGFDPCTPIEESLRALDTLVQHGHVRYIGISNWAAWQIAKALGISERLGLHRFASLQAYYTVAARDLEREIVPMLRSERVGLMVWSPLSGGLLSGKYRRDGSVEGDDNRRVDFDFPPVDKDRTFDVIDAMRPIAARHGVSVAQVALAWLLHRPVVTSVIVGARKVAQLMDNIAATRLALGADEIATLEAAGALPAEYPGWMFERQNYREGQLAQPRRGG